VTNTRADRLALVGNPGSGKSSVGAEWLALREERDSHDGLHASFANELREEVAGALSRVVSDDWHSTPGRNGSRTGARAWLLGQFREPATKDRWRPLLQWWGTDFRREDDEDYWVGRLLERITRFEAVGDRGLARSVVIDDCRFPNEYDALRERGFTFVRLADGETTRTLSAEAAAHESELHWPEFEVDIVLDFEQGSKRQAQRLLALMDERSS
jgi:hypothetical protein